MLLCLFIGCRDDEFYKGDFFYLVNKNAQMPVSVRGNTSSGIFVVFLHGGPGGTALQKIGLPACPPSLTWKNLMQQSFGTSVAQVRPKVILPMTSLP